MAALLATGVRLAVDGIGTCHRTLARLTELPIHVLTIDRAFVARPRPQEPADAVMRAIMQISRTLGLRVVAEGIETLEQAAAVDLHGCDAAQGSTRTADHAPSRR